MLKVMIVDDEKPIRQWFEFILRDIPDMDIHIIGSYPNGQVALKACETELPDVIFCDIIMPVMNGIELIRQAKERYPSVEVLTLESTEKLIKRLETAGAKKEKIQSAVIGYTWQTIEEVKQVVDLSPEWYVLYNNNWYTATDLVKQLPSLEVG
ncbi:MAG: response regulator [Clostridiales bacterium]|nr:response regulator [Clostridiales bacterium]